MPSGLVTAPCEHAHPHPAAAARTLQHVLREDPTHRLRPRDPVRTLLAAATARARPLTVAGARIAGS